MSDIPITGRTRLFGILADPITHVKTPQVLGAVMRERGFDGVLVPFHVTPGGLATVVDGLRRVENFGGFIATVPHKPAMAGLCDEVAPDAALIGAVNCVRRERDGRMVGAMLDGLGFVEGLRRAGIEPRGVSAFLAGAGGAASAIAFALAGAGVTRLTVHNRTAAKAEALLERLARLHPDLPAEVAGPSPEGFGLVVNATSLGMRPSDPPPLDLAALAPGQVVAEAIMEPAETPLLQAAKQAGCTTQPGLPMLQAQADLMADHMGVHGGPVLRGPG